MVENNDNGNQGSNGNEGRPAQRRRKSIFASRRVRSTGAESPRPGADREIPVAHGGVTERPEASGTGAQDTADPARAGQGDATAEAVTSRLDSVGEAPATDDEPVPADEANGADDSNGADESGAAREEDAAETQGDGSPEPAASVPVIRSTTSLIFQAPDLPVWVPRDEPREQNRSGDESTVRRRTRRRAGDEDRDDRNDDPNTQVKVRSPRPAPEPITEPQRVKGSTRLEAKKQRRRDGRDAGRRRAVVTEAEFLARRESVDRVMIVRSKFGRIQIGVLEDGVLVEHYVAKSQEASLIGNVYLGRVQNVLPSMEAAFVDIGRGRNAVLYSGEVDWDAAAENNADGKRSARRIELALKPNDKVLVQVTKDPVGHKGARLTSQVSLPGRYLVYVPNGSMNGISRKLPDTERARLKKLLKEVLPENVGVIVRTAAEGASDEQLTLDVNRLTAQWAHISESIEKAQAPAMLHSEPDLLVKIVRDVFNEDFQKLVIEGEDAAATISTYLSQVAPDLIDRIEKYEGSGDSFDEYRISEQIEKALDRKVWLPSGGSLVIDRTEAMTVVDVNTGKFVGSGGNLEETVTKNNLEAAEEIVRQLRLRDIGGIIVVDFIDMVLETNRDLVLRRLVECLSRDRTKHQVAEVTSLGLVQMTRKKLGLGLLETFSENCEVCAGRGIIVHHDPVTKHRQTPQPETGRRSRKGGGGGQSSTSSAPKSGGGTHAITDDVRNALAKIATSTIAAASESPDAAKGAPDDAASDAAVAESSAETGSDAEATDSAVSDDNGAGGAPSAESTAESTDAAASGTVSRRSRSKGSRGRSGSTRQGDGEARAGDTGPEEGAEQSETVEAVTVAAAEAAVEVLDIPVTPAVKRRAISTEDAEQILGSVLDALPEPPQAGRGRSRTSRRVSSGGTVTASPSDDSVG